METIENRTEELIRMRISLPEIYIMTRVINKIYNKFHHKDIINVIEPIDIGNSFIIPGIKVDFIPEEILYSIVKNLRDLEGTESNAFYDRKLKDNINKIFSNIKYDNNENKLKILKIIFEELKPFKLHYSQCSEYLLPYTLIMIKEWIIYILNEYPDLLSEGNKSIRKKTCEFNFKEKSKETAITSIFQNKICYNCSKGKINIFSLSNNYLECENNKCNYKYKINNYNKEEDIKSDTLNKIYNIRITNNNIEII